MNAIRRLTGCPSDEAIGLPTGARQRRKYRRSEKFKGPRTYRTRRDPFETVWDEVCQWLVVQPERTGRSVFDELRQRYPSQFADGKLRRHIQLWRARTVLTLTHSGSTANASARASRGVAQRV